MNKDFKVEPALIKLVQQERFFAEFLFRTNMRFDNSFPTMAISLDPTKGIEILINSYFWADRTTNEKVDLLKHEILHVIGNHYEREKTVEPELYDENTDKSDKQKVKELKNTKMMLNTAEDAAINEFLPNLPQNWTCYDENGNPMKDEKGEIVKGSPVYVNSIREMAEDDSIKNNQPMEYYYDFIKKNKEKLQQQMPDDSSTVDDHSSWDDLSEQEKEEMKESVKRVSKEAKEASVGNMPAWLEEMLDKLNRKTHNWRKDLKKFVARSAQVNQEASRRRRNRRYGITQPGRIYNSSLKLAVAVDTSASVDNDQLEQFFAELNSITGINNTQVILLECDTEVNAVYEYNPTKQVTVNGRGGTLFKPVFDKVNSKDFRSQFGEVDGLIYLTDGGNWDTNDVEKPKFPVMWALLEGCQSNFDWGFKTEIKVDKNAKAA